MSFAHQSSAHGPAVLPFGYSGSVGFNTTGYLGPGADDVLFGEAGGRALMPRAGVLRSLRVFLDANTLNGNAVVTVRVNGVDTALQVTLPAGVTEGQDLDDQVAVAAADRVTVEIDTTAAGVGGANAPRACLELV